MVSDSQADLRSSRATQLTGEATSALKILLNNRDTKLLDRAIQNFQEAISISPEGDANMLRCVSNLGGALYTRFEAAGDIRDLEDAITYLRRAVELTPADHPRLPAHLSNLGNALEFHFNRFGELQSLEDAIKLKRRAVALSPDDRDYLPNSLNGLGNALYSRFIRIGKLKDIEEAVEVGRRAVLLTPESHSDLPSRLSSLGNALEGRFSRVGEPKDLEEAIRMRERAVELTPGGHPKLPTRLTNLGNVLQNRFDQGGELTILEKAISVGKRAVILTPQGHPDLPRNLSNLGNALGDRYKRTGDLKDIEETIEVKRRAVATTPNDHPYLPLYLHNLANAINDRFQRIGEIVDLEEAVKISHRAVSLFPDDHPELAGLLSDYGNVLMNRFNRTGELSDLEEAVETRSRAVALTPNGHFRLHTRLNDLEIALHSRFHRLGILKDLEEAMSTGRRAVELTSEGHSGLSRNLINFGKVLGTRFDRIGELDDITKAIETKERAVALLPDDHPHLPDYLGNLGHVLRIRFYRLGELVDLKRAVSLYQRAVSLTPNDHPSLPSLLSNLAITLSARYNTSNEIKDLEDAILMEQRATQLTPSSGLDKVGRLINLGNFLCNRFQHLHNHDDLNVAASSAQEALGICAPNHPIKMKILSVLAAVSYLKFRALSDPLDLTAFIAHRTEAARQTSVDPFARFERIKDCIQRSLDNGTVQWERSAQLFPAYDCAISLIPEVVWLGHSINRRFEHLREIGYIANGAAATAISAGNLELAVEWPEQGRSVVWGQLLQLRSPLTELQEQHPDLAAKLQRLSLAIEKAGLGNLGKGESSSLDDYHISSNGDETSYRTRLAEDYKATLAAIREQPGFANFLLPRRLTELYSACENGPVVMLNAHELRCDELILCPSKRIVHVPLPRLTLKIAKAMNLAFIGDLSGYRTRGTKYPESNTKQARSKTRLLFLWSSIVEPVLQAIAGEHKSTDIQGPQHITWCSTGPLSFLPLHAAGDYGSQSGKKAFDHIVSSYTPSLSALIRPKSTHPFSLSRPNNIVVVSQPETLPGVDEEVANIKNQFPPSSIVHLDRDHATVDAVTTALDEHAPQIVHFACHGQQHPEDPTKSAFELHGGGLELSRLMSRTTDDAALAVLSACTTATGDAKLSEEAIHLAAGMLSVGYRAVVGTMWAIHDEDAPLVSAELYAHLRRDLGDETGSGQLRTAHALHAAVAKLREKVGEDNIARWAPYVHFGL